MQAPEVIAGWIKTIQDEGRNLTAWEIDFIESVATQFERHGRVSAPQERVLERIYAEKTP